MPYFGTLGEFNPKREDWENYVDRLDEFFVSNKVTDNAQQRAILNSNVGPDTYKLLVNLLSTRKPKDCTSSELVEALKKHYKSIKSSIMARHDFENRVRQSGESVTDFLAALRAIPQDCKFDNKLDERLKDCYWNQRCANDKEFNGNTWRETRSPESTRHSFSSGTGLKTI